MVFCRAIEFQKYFSNREVLLSAEQQITRFPLRWRFGMTACNFEATERVNEW